MDGSVDYLVEHDCLYVKLKEPDSDDPEKLDIKNRDNWLVEQWPGTDKDKEEHYIQHPYTEPYIDRDCT